MDGRGIGARHDRTRKETNETFEAQWPKIQDDHSFTRSGPNAPLRTCMSAMERVSSCSLAVALQGKGRQDMYAVKMLDDFCRQLGLERAFLQAEPETPPMTLSTQFVGNGHTWYHDGAEMSHGSSHL